MALLAVDDDNKGQFTMHHVVNTRMRGKELPMVYMNVSILVESSVQTMDQLLAEGKYRVVGFDLEFTSGCARQDEKVAIAELCVRHDILIYHYHLATRPYEHFARFINNLDYSFVTVDTTNNLKCSMFRA
ncbi:hypothetical protein D1007_27352 [Hordeum vulgare]|nr:hypothetical protein D1007_27352 [Hordeum vulgare]